MRRMPRQHLNRNVRRERDPRALARQTALLVCGLVFAIGFIAAARQKFVAVAYGYQNEGLRREREQLLEQQRQLLLKLEETKSPAQLERAAREIGLQPTRPAQLSVRAQVEEASDATTERANDTAGAKPRTNASHAFIGASAGGAGVAFRRR